MTQDLEAVASASIRIGPISVHVIVGDLAHLDRPVGALVSPEDSYLTGTATTATSIRHAAASEAVQRQIALLAGWPSTRTPLQPGDAVQTEAGAIDARALLHAVVYTNGPEPDPGALRTGFRRALELADAGRLDPVAMPVAGGNAAPKLVEAVTRATADAIFDFAQTPPVSVRTILLVARSREAVVRMAQILGETDRSDRERARRVAAGVEVLSAHLSPEAVTSLRACLSPDATAPQLLDAIQRLIMAIAQVVEDAALRRGLLPNGPRPEAPANRVVEWTLSTARALDQPGAPPWLAALAEAARPSERTGDQTGPLASIPTAPLAVALARAASLSSRILRGSMLGTPLAFRPELEALFARIVEVSAAPSGIAGAFVALHDSDGGGPPDTVRTIPREEAGSRAKPTPGITTAADVVALSEPLIEKLARHIERHLADQHRRRLDTWLAQRGYGGDYHSRLVELCLDTDLVRLLADLFDPPTLNGMLLPAAAGDLSQANAETLGAAVLRQLGFTVAAAPEGIRAIAEFVERTEHVVRAPRSDQEVRGAVIDTARAVERVCHDLLCLYGSVLFGPDWRKTLGEHGIWSAPVNAGPPTLGTLFETLRRIDSFLEQGNDPVVSTRWISLLGKRPMLGDFGARVQEITALRNSIAHTRRNDPVAGLQGAALHTQANDLYVSLVRPLFQHLTTNAVYPPVVTVHRHTRDLYGRSYADIIDETGRLSTIVTRDRIDPGVCYFMIPRSSPQRVHPLLVRREER